MVLCHYGNALMGPGVGMGEMLSTFTINSLGTMTPSQGPASLGLSGGCDESLGPQWESAELPGPGVSGGGHRAGVQLLAGSVNTPIAALVQTAGPAVPRVPPGTKRCPLWLNQEAKSLAFGIRRLHRWAAVNSHHLPEPRPYL